MNQFLRRFSGWLALLACLGLLGLAGPSFADAEEPLVPGDNIRVTVSRIRI